MRLHGGTTEQGINLERQPNILQVNACLAAGGVNSPLIDYSMISDSSRVIQNGMRIATCMIRYGVARLSDTLTSNMQYSCI